MDDLINRQAAIDALEKEYRCTDRSDDWDGLKTAILIIENLPSAQPQRKTGRWMDNDKINFPQCSECGMWIDVMQQSGEMNYCPNCGADMRGERR